MRALVLALLLACVPVRAAELRIGVAADVTSMDPHAVNIAPNNNIGWHVFDALTHVDENARLIPGLAVSWRTRLPACSAWRKARSSSGPVAPAS